MSLLVNEGKLALINAIFRRTDFTPKLRLYKTLGGGFGGDNFAVALANLTEADFSGYAYVAVDTLYATPPAINGVNEGEVDSPLVTWTRDTSGSPQTILGLYLTLNIAGADKLIFMHHFPASITLVNAGEKVEKYVNIFDDNLIP